MKILFICTHNRCRSILAEAITRKISAGKINVRSAGSAATGKVHELTLQNLKRHDYDVEGLQSESWDDLGDFSPDICITVCDNAAKEACPLWPEKTIKIHWGLTDPTKVANKTQDNQKTFDTVITTLENRIRHICQYDLNEITNIELENLFNIIGEKM